MANTTTTAAQADELVERFATLIDSANASVCLKAAREFEAHAARYNRMAVQLRQRAQTMARTQQRQSA
jgi:hypothetical protein